MTVSRKMIFLCIVLLLALLAPPFAAAAGLNSSSALVTELRHWSNPDYTRIAITIDREVHFETHRLPPNADAAVPSRIYLDIAGKLGKGVKDIKIGDRLLKAARIGQYRPDTVRVVLDLASIGNFKVFTFSDPFRIIVDIKGDSREEITRPRETVLAPLVPYPPPPVKVERNEEKVKVAVRPAIGKIRRIVVDAGHGGHDPGARGAGGTNEKDVVLSIALKLARRLREDLGLDVVLTRSTDVFLELQERTAIANQVGADLFVSIHANASPNRNTSGIETYYLNLAKTEKAAQLAAKENGTSLEKVSLLQAVLFDLMANYKLNDSALLADEVQKALHRKVAAGYPASRNLGVKQGPFYVLVGATMPSILVETSFLSNSQEEERLKDPQYQETTAEGIMEGIKGYITAVK
jgi:N-acetylmuramoyl-L-alanine amidase